MIEFEGADVITVGLGVALSVAMTSNALYAVEAVNPDTVMVVVLPLTVGDPDKVELVNAPPAVCCCFAV